MIGAALAGLARCSSFFVFVRVKHFTTMAGDKNELVRLGAGSRMIPALSNDGRGSRCRKLGTQLINAFTGRDINGCAKMWAVIAFLYALAWLPYA